MAEKFEKFEISEFLDDNKIIAEYLDAVLGEDDTDLLISAIGDIAKAKGIKHVAEKAGVGRESLYKSFKEDAKPRFETISKVLKALDLRLTVKPENGHDHPRNNNSQSTHRLKRRFAT
ncbi:MAG: putative addiction module antidote protein [Fidelibacterota bacterium]